MIISFNRLIRLLLFPVFYDHILSLDNVEGISQKLPCRRGNSRGGELLGKRFGEQVPLLDRGQQVLVEEKGGAFVNENSGEIGLHAPVESLDSFMLKDFRDHSFVSVKIIGAQCQPSPYH